MRRQPCLAVQNLPTAEFPQRHPQPACAMASRLRGNVAGVFLHVLVAATGPGLCRQENRHFCPDAWYWGRSSMTVRPGLLPTLALATSLRFQLRTASGCVHRFPARETRLALSLVSRCEGQSRDRHGLWHHRTIQPRSLCIGGLRNPDWTDDSFSCAAGWSGIRRQSPVPRRRPWLSSPARRAAVRQVRRRRPVPGC